MKSRYAVALAVLACAVLLAPAGIGQDQDVKVISVSDEAVLLPGTSTVAPVPGTRPPQNPAGRVINQMPNWPITIGGAGMFAPSRGMVFADLNNDGYLEIITSSTDGYIYAWDHTGAAMPGFPVGVVEMAQYAPAVADVDGDGDMEIAQFSRGTTSGGRVYLLDHQGNVLPGFPINVNNNYLTSTPTLHDLDNDGDMEIIGGERDYPFGYLHVFEIDGTEWGGNWPVQLDHVPTGTATVGDVDNDGDVEIFYMSYDSMYLLEIDGTNVAGWPKQIANANFSYQSAAMADLDGDDDLEIIVGAHKNAAGCYVFHHDGTTFPGWPNLVGTWTYCAPTVTDLEGDGALEILDGRAGMFGGYSNCFWAWTTAGAVKPGFPYGSSNSGGSEGPLTVADINNDGRMEIFADSNVMVGGQGFLYGVDSYGNDLPDFPLRPQGFTYMNGATIGDVDGDGDYELGVLSRDDYGVYINLYDLSGTYHPSDVSWETYHKKNSRGGLHGSEDRLVFHGHCAIGNTVRLVVHDTPGHKAFLWISRGIARTNYSAFGWFYLDWNMMLNFKVFNTTIPASGEVITSVPIPNNPGLVGTTFYFQGMTGADPFLGDGKVTNLLGRTVQ